MQIQIEKIYKDFLEELKSIKDLEGLEEIRVKYLGRKSGLFTSVMMQLGSLSVEEKKIVGPIANQIKIEIENNLNSKEKELKAVLWNKSLLKEKVDITAPSLPAQKYGHLHPATLIQHDLEELFTSMGFMVLDGPELESDYYNFSALNIPESHPARDMQDTLYIKNHADWLMRTQTSDMQVRAMQKYGAPLRAIVPGKCFRNESTDARHEHTFYQLEGFVIDKNITFAHMKGVMQVVADHLFGKGTKLRLMPKFYPFVEPGVRGELTCLLCKGMGCKVCKNTGWLEVMPGGMIHPNVLKECGVNPKEYQGFAFGFGLTRLAMLKYGIDDVRLMESGDVRFLEQF